MAAIAESRFGTIDDERTELFVVGAVHHSESEDGHGYCIIALPFQGALHSGQWSSFSVRALDGSKRPVRFSRMPRAQRKGLRRQPPANWDGHLSFASNDRLRLEELAATYEGHEEDLNQSVVLEPDIAMGDPALPPEPEPVLNPQGEQGVKRTSSSAPRSPAKFAAPRRGRPSADV